jgi:hypothetical protein
VTGSDQPPSGPSAADPSAPSFDPDAAPSFDPNADPTPPRPARATGPVQYKGADLEAERGPGLGCFRFQIAVLLVFVVLTPLSAIWGWPEAVSAAMLFVVVALLLTTGQTIIFLLRLVAADRRSRRRPLASGTKTVGELEDELASPGHASHAPDRDEDPAR